MGGKFSTTTKAMRMNNKNLVKKETTSNLQHCKQQLETVQQDILRDSQHRDPVQVAQMLVVTEKAKHQLERDDKPLTKNDMIAILVALGAVPLREMDTVEATQTVPELISQIRGTVYDVERLVGCGSGGGGRGKALPAASVPALPSSRAALPSPLLPPSKPPRFMAIKNF